MLELWIRAGHDWACANVVVGVFDRAEKGLSKEEGFRGTSCGVAE